jgi:hypothetical protein
MKPTFIQARGGTRPGTPHLNPPANCDACSTPITNTFFDAATPQGWGNFCPTCAKTLHITLGPGRGQEYIAHGDEK